MATAAAAAWARLFLQCQWQFSYSVFPPWAAVEGNLPERAVMTMSTKYNNNGSGRSEVYNWINSGLLTYKQVELILNQHFEPHLSTQYYKNQTKSSVWFWRDWKIEIH